MRTAFVSFKELPFDYHCLDCELWIDSVYPWAEAIIEVCDGYMVFESFEDYVFWLSQD